jgi:hypothetical protein
MDDNMDIDGGAMEVDMADEDENENRSPPQFVPFNRRPSNAEEDHRHRRASIKAILADDSITPTERRKSIQHLMDGRRSSIGTNSVASSSGSSTPVPNDLDYGYGDVGPTMAQQNNSLHNYGEPPSFAYEGDQCVPVANDSTKRAEQSRPHCSHYERKCTMIAPCCGAAFGCRICHDDSPILPPLLIMKQTRRYPRSSSLPGSFTAMQQTPEESHHNIDRFAVKEIICRECYTKQSSQA